MQHLEVSGAVRPLKWPLGVKWLKWVTKYEHITPQIACAVIQLTICVKFTFVLKLQLFYWINWNDRHYHDGRLCKGADVISFKGQSQDVTDKGQWIVRNKFEPLTVSAKPFGRFSSKFTFWHNIHGVRGGVVVKALGYKQAGRGFDSGWWHWNFSVT